MEETKAACKNAGLDIELSAAAEYMIDDYFLDLLRNRSPLLTLHKNILLTEISYSTPPVNLEAITAAIFAGDTNRCWHIPNGITFIIITRMFTST
ncbi:MAG: hypothetical protein IPJ02_08870 [Chitinophagaceae bacterium]|nr:hypothetical protein [Chitinophagaceae bacterium]